MTTRLAAVYGAVILALLHFEVVDVADAAIATYITFIIALGVWGIAVTADLLRE